MTSDSNHGHHPFLSNSFTSDIQAMISEVFPSNDQLDSPDFDPIEFINARLPSEQSITELEPLAEEITSMISNLDTEISKAVEAQSAAGEQATRDVEEAKNAIHELFRKIQDIKAKSEQSENIVQEVCRDIKELDQAKQNLQKTISVLNKLNVLIMAVDQFELMVNEGKYQQSAISLDAVNQLLSHFESYSDHPKIAEIRLTVFNLQSKLSSRIDEIFKRIGDFASTVADINVSNDLNTNFESLNSLKEACMVVDSLGIEVRKKQIQFICLQQLRSYEKLFNKKSDAYSLQQIDRRFAWFKRILREFDQKYENIFPIHWKLQHKMCLMFMEETRTHILDILSTGGPDCDDVQILLMALQKCLTFEKEMKLRFEADALDSTSPENIDLDEQGNLIDPNSAEGIRLKYAKLEAQKRLKEQQQHSKDLIAARKQRVAPLGKSSNLPGEEEEVFIPIFGLISGVFDSFMEPYIRLERKNMNERLEEIKYHEDTGTNGKLLVFSSSVDTFAYIKNSIQRCTALTTGKTFFSLQKEFKNCLLEYAKVLENKVTTIANPGSIRNPKHIEDGEIQLCFTINTAEYCGETIQQLEKIIRQKIDKSYQESIKFDKESEKFQEVVGLTIRALVTLVENKIEPSLKSMSTINWGACEGVGEESGYVREISRILSDSIPKIRSTLSTVYFRNFCDKFSSSFLSNYFDLIIKQKRINDFGSQQLLLDAYNLKTLILHVPNLGLEEQEAPPIASVYTKLVSKLTAKIEVVLKLIGTPSEVLVERFRVMWPTGEAKDLQMIMSIKGCKKNEQQSLLETFGLETPTQTR